MKTKSFSNWTQDLKVLGFHYGFHNWAQKFMVYLYQFQQSLLFENLSLNLVEDNRIDIADSDEVINLIKGLSLICFHLAAQPIGISLLQTLLTFKSNTLGTTNILRP